MVGVALLLAAAAAGHAAAVALRLPAIPLLLLAGVALTHTGFLPTALLADALMLGAAFMLFATGLELDPRRIRTQRRVVLRVGLVQFSVLAALGLVTALLLGFGALAASYLALALTASSTLVGIRLLQRRRQLFEPFGRLVMGVLLLQDLLVILAIPVVTELPDGWQRSLLGLGAVLGLGLLTIVARRWGAPLLLRLQDDEEALLLGALALLFLFLATAGILSLPLVAGAFLAGVALSRFPVSGVVRAELLPIGDFFSAIFFTALGAFVQVPTLSQLGQALVLALLVVVVTPPLVTLVAERAGFSARPALEAGLLLSQTSELSLVVGLHAMLAGHIEAGVFTVIALMTLITMLLTPFLATDAVVWRLLRLHPLRRPEALESPPGDHVLLLGSGTTGMPLVETLLGAGCAMVVVDEDPSVIERLRNADLSCIRGDASDPEVLRRARAEWARVVSSSIRRPEDNRPLLELTRGRGVPVLVRVFDEEDAAWVSELGGIPVLYSEAAADGLLEWYERERPALAERLRARLGEEASGEASAPPP